MRDENITWQRVIKWRYQWFFSGGRGLKSTPFQPCPALEGQGREQAHASQSPHHLQLPTIKSLFFLSFLCSNSCLLASPPTSLTHHSCMPYHTMTLPFPLHLFITHHALSCSCSCLLPYSLHIDLPITIILLPFLFCFKANLLHFPRNLTHFLLSIFMVLF